MQIRFKGSPKKLSLSECRDALHFWSKMLFRSGLSKQLKLTVIFKSQLDEPTHIAECSYSEDYENNPKNFEIILRDNLGFRNTLMALAHEFTHIKQYAKGELKHSVRYVNKVIFKKKLYDDFRDEDRFYYFNLPYEIEAFGREYGLYALYKDYRKEKRKKNKKK